MKTTAVPSSGKYQFGFSLVELVVTILLIAILSATALPRFMPSSSVSGYTMRDEVIGELRRTQLMAMNNADRCYRLNFTSGGYQLIHYAGRSGNLCTGTVEYSDKLQALPSDTSLSLLPGGNQSFFLDFNRQGQAYWGAVNLCAGNCIQITADDDTKVAIESQGYIHAGS
ncbi:MAG: type II secretion system GspH family protein [Shewanella sp.]|nr:type II secretion system GspH family protein [Shewanella sp.]MCF1429497.1 type II secretion system GspH family protein [Shewanella sp.]MCF1438316.1 type II secretion system GspH family protein [Shewanella sp.]MCF1457681.1 type II secretion system GspH family protein [Shewanella sp.]